MSENQKTDLALSKRDRLKGRPPPDLDEALKAVERTPSGANNWQAPTPGERQVRPPDHDK